MKTLVTTSEKGFVLDKKDVLFVNDFYQPIIPIKFILKMEDALSKWGKNIQFDNAFLSVCATLSAWRMEKWYITFKNVETRRLFVFRMQRHRVMNQISKDINYGKDLSVILDTRYESDSIGQYVFNHTFRAKTFMKTFDFTAIAYTIHSNPYDS